MVNTVIKASTKRGQALLAKARWNQGEDLDEVYGSYSSKKKDAWKDCKRQCEEEAGEDFRIISHNSNFFSVAWDFEYDGQPAVHIVTHANSFVVVGEEVNE